MTSDKTPTRRRYSSQFKAQVELVANPKLFSSGWRPFMRWTCVAGFTVQFVVEVVWEWISGLIGPQAQPIGQRHL
jgi:hypothetical protein